MHRLLPQNPALGEPGEAFAVVPQTEVDVVPLASTPRRDPPAHTAMTGSAMPSLPVFTVARQERRSVCQARIFFRDDNSCSPHPSPWTTCGCGLSGVQRVSLAIESIVCACAIAVPTRCSNVGAHARLPRPARVSLKLVPDFKITRALFAHLQWSRSARRPAWVCLSISNTSIPLSIYLSLSPICIGCVLR